MNKQQLIDEMATLSGLSKSDTRMALNAMISIAK